MDQDVKDMLPKPDDKVPPLLRKVMEEFKANRATAEDLVDASFTVALDFLDEYKPRPLPDPPEEVRKYRALPVFERMNVGEHERANLCRRYTDYYNSLSSIESSNKSSKQFLENMLKWAESKKLPNAILQKIKTTIKKHQQAPVNAEEILEV